MYVLIGILLLGILVAVHEFGHFIAARISGIEVMEFAIGMGPKIVGWTGKSGTKFSLRCIPLGGFCAFYGEDDVEGKSKDDPRAYGKQNVWKRIFTVAMGPVMNFVLAFVVAFGFFFCLGETVGLPVVDTLMAGYPAEAAGLLPGDEIIAVDGVDIAGTNAIVAALAEGGAAEITVLRGGEEQVFLMTPKWSENEQRYLIGITFVQARQRLDFMTSVRAGWQNCVRAGTAVFDALGSLFTKEGMEQVSGPVGAVAAVSVAVKADGLDAFLSLLMLISVNLGLMNLLPIPGLDGSRILFHLVEAVRGKPIKPEREAMVHLIGMVFLLSLMVFFTYKDIVRIFFN